MTKYFSIIDGVVAPCEFGEVVEVSVDYDKGNGYNSVRGMKLFITPMERTQSEHYISNSFMMFDSRNKKYVLETATRKSAKLVDKWEKLINEHIEEILLMHAAGKYNEIMDFINTIR